MRRQVFITFVSFVSVNIIWLSKNPPVTLYWIHSIGQFYQKIHEENFIHVFAHLVKYKPIAYAAVTNINFNIYLVYAWPLFEMIFH